MALRSRSATEAPADGTCSARCARITRSEGNVLFELDGEPALDLYERYLGPEARGLPGSGLLYPLQIYGAANPDHKVVRTILAVDREQRSLTFAGDVPADWRAQLMRGSLNRLANGAAEAASQAAADSGTTRARTRARPSW